MPKKSMAMILVACLLTFTLLSSAPLLSNVWWGVSVAAGRSNSTAGEIMSGWAVIEGVKWGIIAGVAGASIAASAGVGLVVGA